MKKIVWVFLAAALCATLTAAAAAGAATGQGGAYRNFKVAIYIAVALMWLIPDKRFESLID